MSYNKIMQIKDKRERFCALRREIIGESCKETKENEYDIYLSCLRILKRAGYDIESNGTKQLAKLVTIFYHERKLYRRKDINKKYWNLDCIDNPHYLMLGENKNDVILDMDLAIKNSGEDVKISEVVYEMADYQAYMNNIDERRERYVKLLKK